MQTKSGVLKICFKIIVSPKASKEVMIISMGFGKEVITMMLKVKGHAEYVDCE